MLPSRMHYYVKPVGNYICNRSLTDEIDTEIAFCTSKIRILFPIFTKTEYKVNAQ